MTTKSCSSSYMPYTCNSDGVEPSQPCVCVKLVCSTLVIRMCHAAKMGVIQAQWESTMDMPPWTVWDASLTASDALLVKWVASATAELSMTPLLLTACHKHTDLVAITNVA